MHELPDREPGDAAGLAQLQEHYRVFAEVEAAPVSPRYARWASGVAEDTDLLQRLLALPAAKRQANLLFASAQFHGVQAEQWAQARAQILNGWAQIAATMRGRATQTNEPGRIAALNLAFSAIQDDDDAPLALIEVGASAGLCLYPDAWPTRYLHAGQPDRELVPPEGSLRSAVQLRCELSGLEAPRALPRVGYRAGIDLNPLDLTDAADQRWLESLIWPGMEYRIPRIRAGAEILAQDPPEMFAGDLNDRLAHVLDQVPAGMTPVVFHTAVLAYLSRQDRRRFRSQVEAVGVRWVSNEGIRIIEGIAEQLPRESEAESGFVLSLDGEPLARTAPHGQAARALRR